MNDLIVGIDLGTTNSVLAAVIDGEPRVINLHGQPTLPSCVGLDPQGKLLVGQAAKNQLVAAPDSTLLSIKRRMGEETRVRLANRDLLPEEVSACILREIKSEGEKALGRPISKAVITVPAFFNERQRKATQIAGELAGLEVARIINEPTAAALAYGAGQGDDEKILVYDLGGGTLDVSLVVVEQHVVEVKASHGDTHLGGDDFDELLVRRALQEFQDQYGRDMGEDPVVGRRLKVALEKAKCRLSDQPFVKVREEYLTSEHHLDIEISRVDYEEMIRPLLDQTLVCINQALEDAGLKPGDLDKVMLVGGSTRTPLVQSLLADRLQCEPRWEINPDLIVALGAAVQGAIISGHQHRSVLVDITPHTFSNAAIAHINGFSELVCCPIIHRNTPLPAAKSEVFATQVDNQEEVIIKAFQGEGTYPEENVAIGEFMIENLSRVPEGNQVIVHFQLDLNGMLHATATEKSTGHSKTVVMDTRERGESVDLDQARLNIESLLNPAEATETEVAVEESLETTDTEATASSPKGTVPEELLHTAKDLRKRSESLLHRLGEHEDADEIRQLVQGSSEAIEAGDWSTLSRQNDALSDLLFYLED